jgi:DNA replication protein DnaC
MILALVQQWAWIGTHENVLVLGPTGVGKSFVACALAQKACHDGYSPFYTRAQSLSRDQAMARARPAAYGICWPGSLGLMFW